MLPCADCEGITTKIILKSDLTYTKTEKYEGVAVKSSIFEEKGTFVWDKTGSIITLLSKENVRKYKVLENKLQHLDNDGNIIESNFADMYFLNKM